MKNTKAFMIGTMKTAVAVIVGLVIYDVAKRVIIPKFKKVSAPASTTEA